MSCRNSPDISFEFIDDFGVTYLEIRPRKMQFSVSRGSFDYCKAEFSNEVAELLRPQISDDTSVLRNPLPVDVKIKGEKVYPLLWIPEGAMFTDGAVHIEFHDKQKYLTRGEVDWRRDTVRLDEAYNYVFSQRDTSGPEVFKGIKFSVPEEAFEEVRSTKRGSGDKTINNPSSWISGQDTETGKLLRAQRNDEDPTSSLTEDQLIRSLEEENVYNIIKGHSAVDFDKITPWEAILDLNKKFGVRTWAGANGYLWVGSRFANQRIHFATPDDERVWKLSEYNVTPPRDPVVKSVVRGGWADDPSENISENIAEIKTLNKGTKEFRIEGVATVEKNEFNFGQEIITEIDGKKDVLENVAKRRMMNKQRQQWEGYIELRPDLSGDEWSDIRYVSIGDSILTIPPSFASKDGSCDSNIKEALFDVVGVTHGLDGSGDWTVRVDIVPKLEGDLDPSNIKTKLRYYDPADKKLIEDISPSEKDSSYDGFFPDSWFSDARDYYNSQK